MSGFRQPRSHDLSVKAAITNCDLTSIRLRFDCESTIDHTCVGDGGGGMGSSCPNNSGKHCFSGKYYVKFGHFVNFSDRNRVKLGNFVNFSSKYHVKFGPFVNFSYIYFRQKCLAPKLTDLLRLRYRFDCVREQHVNEGTNPTRRHFTFVMWVANVNIFLDKSR